MNEVINHYDLLIDEDNDPVNEPQILKDYMNKWDGQTFFDLLELDNSKSVLEIGIGTGRIAIKTAPFCKHLTGIDISPKTIERAKCNLKHYSNITFINADFMEYEFGSKFDLIYCSLTFMHIKEKQQAVNIVSKLLKSNGKFIISIDKNQSDVIDMGIRKIHIYPDNPDDICRYINNAGLYVNEIKETEFAYIISATKSGCVN